MGKSLKVVILLVCCAALAQGFRVYAASQAKKLSDLSCTFGQTVLFDGMFWNCSPMPRTGITGLVRVQATTAPENDFIATKEIDAVCPSGKKALGGGYGYLFGGETVTPRFNGPLLDLSAWRVSGTNTESTDWRLTAFAICADIAAP